MQVSEAYHAPDLTPLSPHLFHPPLPTQSAPTLTTDHIPAQPTPTSTTDPTHITPSTQTPTTRRRATYRRVRGCRIQSSSTLLLPGRRTRAAYEDTPTSSPDHSPLCQRLRRATESYSAEESESDPTEESYPTEESDPDEEPEEEPLPAEHTSDAQIQDTSMDVDTPLRLGQRAAILRTGEEDLDAVPTTFEIGQSSRDVYHGDDGGVTWRDLECVFSTIPRVESPVDTPSYVPPSPSIQVSTPQAASPPEEGEVTGMEQIFILLGSQATLLDEHTQQLERLGVLDDRTGMLDRELEGMRRRIGDMQRELRSVWDTAWGQWQRMHEMEFQIGSLTRAGQEDRYEILSARGRIASLETRLEAQLAVNQEFSRRLERFEATQEEILEGLGSLSLE
ncbi:hypothetical protein CTI12_AA544830 [Artemisia annua]|uniref:Uncharacterized protein n=1 Tax=Artemisia annua TaxID=35608 RepID=A0A2U1L0B7_ARTAN|nr:hypothetical protein CTI12_AA544830 [Artemisia annua]